MSTTQKYFERFCCIKGKHNNKKQQIFVIWFPLIKYAGSTYAPNRTCTPAIGYFHDKTKISKEFLRVDYYLPLKYSTRQ